MTLHEKTLQSYLTDAFRQFTKREATPEIHVSFYPFAGLNHSIRIRRQRVYVRVSDLLRDAPPQVQRALAYILVAKLFNKRARAEHHALYRQYAYQPQVLRASELARRERGRKRLSGALGQVYNLDLLFARLNRRYFDNALNRPALSWSQRRTKRILGHHDHAHDAIVISRSLDQANVPEFLIEYVLYHEMLHLKHRPRLVNGRRIYHPPAFRADERRFAHYHEAVAWLDAFARQK
jgi:predicted metal-dependent hydrolase